MRNFAAPETTKLSVVLNMPLTELPDDQLVSLCQQNNEKAFDILFRRHQAFVKGMLGKVAPDWNDREDLSQEVFFRMYVARPRRYDL